MTAVKLDGIQGNLAPEHRGFHLGSAEANTVWAKLALTVARRLDLE